MHEPGPIDVVTRAVLEALAPRGRIVLAISGGLDSMVLLDAAARTVPGQIAAVATFDHATGPHATAAIDLVRRTAEMNGLQTAIGRAPSPAKTESAWRAQRWRFLHHVAGGDPPASVVTAHTRDDHLETVLMRVMRGSGARGLAALHAPSPIVRPFIDISRATLAAYAAERGLAHVEDPSNASRSHLRNRIRLDILPALVAARPALADELLDLSWRAAAVRTALGAAIDESRMARVHRNAVHVATAALAGYDSTALSALWPALAGRVGAVLDWRGTQRLAAFSRTSRTGARMQLSGGWEVVRRRDELVLHRAGDVLAEDDAMELIGELRFGNWYFRVADPGTPDDSAWVSTLPGDRTLKVRAWRAGDRLARGGESGAPRRVKRFFGEAGIAGPDRRGWPVVLADEEIVWIPGVRRSDAATVRSGRPVVLYACDRIDR